MLDPRKLMTQDEAALYCKIDATILSKWTESGHAPHVFYANQGPLYQKAEITRWLKENLTQIHRSMKLPERLDICMSINERESGGIPISIASISTLCELTITGQVPGIYFLCRDSNVVYVGQSVCIFARVGQHFYQATKKFDRAFFLPCPKEDLNTIEKHFISTLDPEYNGSNINGSSRK